MAVNFDPTELRRQYDSMTDEALLEIKPEDLAPEANQILEAELEKRGLLEDAPPPATSGDDPVEELPNTVNAAHPAGQLVAIATYTSVTDARFAVNLLRSAEIPCGVDQNPYSPEINLMVPAELVDQANEVLNTEISEEDLAAQAEAAIPEGDADPESE